MNVRTLLATITFSFLATAPAWAGPPVVCHVVQIGSAQSLPWNSSLTSWNGSDPSYNISNVVDDTLKILTASAPTELRMETLRRAAIYSARQDDVAGRLLGRLIARVRSSESAHRSAPTAWFDAAYYAEGVRELRRAYSLPQLTPGLDEVGWIRNAVRLGGKHMEQAVALVQSGHMEAR